MARTQNDNSRINAPKLPNAATAFFNPNTGKTEPWPNRATVLLRIVNNVTNSATQYQRVRGLEVQYINDGGETVVGWWRNGETDDDFVVKDLTDAEKAELLTKSGIEVVENKVIDATANQIKNLDPTAYNPAVVSELFSLIDLYFQARGGTGTGLNYWADNLTFQPIAANGNYAPVASAVKLNGPVSAGSTLSISFTYMDQENDPQGAHVKKFYSYSTTSGADPVLLATADTYVIQASDIGRYLRGSVKPVATTGTPNGTETFSEYSTIVTGAQNLALWSEELANPVYQPLGSGQVTSNVITAPDNTLTADMWTAGTDPYGYVFRQNINFTGGQQYTGSVHLKKGTHRYVAIRIAAANVWGGNNPFIDLNTNLQGVNEENFVPGTSMTIETLPDNWVRVHITYTPPTDTVDFFDLFLVGADGYPISPAGTETLYAWGFSVRKGLPGSYNKTTSSIIPGI